MEPMENTAQNKMGVMPIGKLVLNMSVPMMISMLVQALYNVVDSVFVSMVSREALSAVSFSFPAQNLMIGLATGTAVGVNALLSRALGAGDRERANRVAEHGVFLSLIGYLLFLLFGLFGSRAFMLSQTQVPEIVEYGVDYLTVVCCFSFGLYGQTIFERLMQATGRTFYTMITQGLGAIINIILDPISSCRRATSCSGCSACPSALTWARRAPRSPPSSVRSRLHHRLYPQRAQESRHPPEAARVPSPAAPDRSHLRHRLPVGNHDGDRLGDDVADEHHPRHLYRGQGDRRDGVRRVLQAQQLRVHAGVRPEQRRDSNHGIQLRRAEAQPHDAGDPRVAGATRAPSCSSARCCSCS